MRVFLKTHCQMFSRSVAKCLLLIAPSILAQHSYDPGNIVAEATAQGAFPLVGPKGAAPLLVAKEDFWGVQRAAEDLRDDIERVSGRRPSRLGSLHTGAKLVVVAGTLGKSPELDQLIARHKIDVSAVRGKWESFLITTIENPLPGVDQALIIAGSDKRGTIYGLYQISEEAGVSPWYWWADVPAKHRDRLYVLAGPHIQGPPAVKYRGIFINDEEPALGKWSREKFGGVNSKMYSHMFELLLRLRANFLWPAMWGKAFNEDDPENPRLADAYGIVMGTSHHEPMMRAQKEWGTHRKEYGNGDWNYVANREGLDHFWSDGVKRNGRYENVYTIGMRGDGDVAMPDAGGFDADKKLLEQIIRDQRDVLKSNVDPDIAKVPQVWALFTEVQKYYDAGLQVPDDVTLLFTDDNVGNLRRVPTAAERARSGGTGIYYHLDMNGGPFSYKWLNSNPLPKIWEQMNLAYRYGADRLWIANVGDLKPLEVPIEFFLRLAWDPNAISKDDIQQYLAGWAEREFGPAHAIEIADIVAKYAKYNASPKPELIHPDTFSQVHYQEAERIYNEWADLATRAEKIKADLPMEMQDAYYELVLHPVLACGNAAQLNIVAGRNRLFLSQGRLSANADAKLAVELFQRDQQLTDYYNKGLANGKWNHMMDQIHLGYTTWSTPPSNAMPTVDSIVPSHDTSFGVAVEGSELASPKNIRYLSLPAFNSLRSQEAFFDVFPMGDLPDNISVTAKDPWVHLHRGEAFSPSSKDARYVVSIDWANLPTGLSSSSISVTRGAESTSISVEARKASEAEQGAAAGAYSGGFPIAIDASKPTRNIPVGDIHWEVIPDYGRESSAVSIFPVTAEPIKAGQPAPELDYDVFFPRSGSVMLDLITNPTLNIYPGRQLSVAVAIDDELPETRSVFTPKTAVDQDFLGKIFSVNDRNNTRTMTWNLNEAAGRHILRIKMVDPTLVIEKIVFHTEPLPASFFGPPVQSPSGVRVVEGMR